MKHNISLMDSVNKLEDSIITISGPALAISGIIAGVDLVTGGNILRSVSWLALVWAICLLLTLDFQVLALGARTHRVYLSNKTWKQKTCEIVLAVLIAAAISYVSIQMQSVIARANSTTPMLSIDVATSQMGINPIALIWERSALVLVLIFLSGWFRDLNVSGVSPVSPETKNETPETAAVISEETMQLILGKLEKLDQLEQLFTAQVVTVSPAIETPLALPETVHETPETPPVLSHQIEIEEPDEPALEAQISALLQLKADASSREIATIVGRPHTTVYRALSKIKQQSKSGETPETSA